MQILLAFVVVVVTVMLVVVFSQVYLILKEFRQTVIKTNKILDDTGSISESISRPINLVSMMLMGLKGGAILKSILRKGGKG